MFIQQIRNIFISFSLPLIGFYTIFPAFFLSFEGQIICSLMLGAYIWHLHWTGLKNFTNALQFSPTSVNKDQFHALIQECNVNPHTVMIKYAYTNGQTAQAADSTIIIDPLMWHGLSDDPEAIKAQNVIETHVLPQVLPAQKERIAAIRSLLTPGTQRFMVKHELGHIFYNFSYNKLIVLFVIGSLATYCGIEAAKFLLPYNGFVATFAGMIVGWFSDLLFTFASNIIWTWNEEKKADLFAVQYSTYEDVQEAACFFEKHQEVLDMHKEPGNFLEHIPSVIRSGHPNGAPRAAYLRALAEKKLA